jgi:hypothetical protein
VIGGKSMIEKSIKPTCLFCQNGKYIKGCHGTMYSPPELERVECQVPNEQLAVNGDQHGWDEEVMPSVCGCFNPTMITKCGHCGKEMNEPKYSLQLVTYDFPFGEPIYVCSEECQDASIAKLDEKRKELTEYLESHFKYIL